MYIVTYCHWPWQINKCLTCWVCFGNIQSAIVWGPRELLEEIARRRRCHTISGEWYGTLPTSSLPTITGRVIPVKCTLPEEGSCTLITTVYYWLTQWDCCLHIIPGNRLLLYDCADGLRCYNNNITTIVFGKQNRIVLRCVDRRHPIHPLACRSVRGGVMASTPTCFHLHIQIQKVEAGRQAGNCCGFSGRVSLW